MVNRYAVARRDPGGTAVQVARNTPVPAAPVAAVPDTAATTAAYAAANSSQPVRVAAENQVFHGLFRSDGEHDVVAPIVSSLWSTQPSAAGAPRARGAAMPAATAVPGPGAPLDLFQEQAPDARALFRGRV